MLERIVPPDVSTADCYGDPPDAFLLPEEEGLVRGVVDSRKAEVTTVRHLARRALALAGSGPVPVLRGSSKAPVWPSGIVGSMTHCDGFRAAAVAPATRFRAIGIDAEPSAPVSAGVLRHIATPAEAGWVHRLRAAEPDVAWDRLLFCAKEAFYKVWSPLTGSMLGFMDVEVVPTTRGRLAFEAVRPDVGSVSRFVECRWIAHSGFLAVSAWIRNR